jgi:C1A family cysteine protease
VEGTWYLAGNDLISLSEQQLVACDTWINSGCDGGLPEVAMMYIENAGGMVSEAMYEYKKVNMYTDSVRYPNCDVSIVQKKNYAAHIDYWQKVSSSSDEEYKMALALIKSGPLSVALNAEGMEDYSSGVDNPKKCSDSDIDHAVLIVGYGVEDGVEYW